ncbi:DoxX family membrane protein [Zhihengliuella sp.]|uniref:DoxX family protein n=1 Tax=Zhihengliuella sp. TaxID=1954483 RepID=UPI0028117922|nr:DoxX family membrane protein [Zhihengliuella sp.]
MSAIRVLARPLLASSFVYAGYERLTKPQETADNLRGSLKKIASKCPQVRSLADRPETVARLLGGVQLVAGLFYALGRSPRLSATALVVSSLIGAADDYKDLSVADKLKTASLSGGVLLAAADTSGAPSVAWRAQHLGRSARKDLTKAGQKASRTVRRSAKSAAKTAEGILEH